MRRMVLASVAVALAAAAAEAQVYTRRNKNGVIEATNVPDEIDFRLIYPGKGAVIHSQGFSRRAYDGRFDRHIEDASVLHGVAADLIRAVIQVESEFDSGAVSSKGAQGLMQLMPFTARRFGVSNAFDPRQNIFAGVQYLRFLLDLFGGDVALACAGYNAGENAVLRHKGIPPYKETQNYVRKIQSLLGGVGALAMRSAATFYAPAAPTIAYAPSAASRALRAARPTTRGKITPARPRTYFKYRDEKGGLHVSHDPPGDGVVYTTIRAD